MTLNKDCDILNHKRMVSALNKKRVSFVQLMTSIQMLYEFI